MALTTKLAVCRIISRPNEEQDLAGCQDPLPLLTVLTSSWILKAVQIWELLRLLEDPADHFGCFLHLGPCRFIVPQPVLDDQHRSISNPLSRTDRALTCSVF